MDLAKHGPSELWIAARSADSGNATVAQIKKASPGVQVHFLPLDLSSFNSIKDAGRTFLRSVSRLNLFFMNAGIMSGLHVTTEDGYKTIRHKPHGSCSSLQASEAPLTQDSIHPRCRFPHDITSSAGHRFGKKDLLLESMKSTAENLSPTDKYCHSKLVNAIYTHALAKYVPQITSVSVYPGDIQVSCSQPSFQRLGRNQTTG
jgi:retinol dehydrogenase-12